MFSSSWDSGAGVGKHRTAETRMPHHRGFLVLVAGEGRRRVCPILGPLVLGRDRAADLQVKEADVSRRHARVFVDDDGALGIEDLRSRNGTRVNGVAVKRSAIAMGDRIQLGERTVLVVSPHDPVDGQLLHLHKLECLGRLAGGVAHDFNNLLGVVLANLSYLADVAGDARLTEAPVQAAVGDAIEAARRGMKLTRQLLGFARRGNYEERPVDLGALVEEVARLLSAPSGPRVRIAVEVEPGLRVMGDGAQLEQVVMSLCVNAVDAVREAGDGEVTVSLAAATVTATPPVELALLPRGRYAVLSVRDTGCGMDDETRARVFEPFFSTKGPDGGTGLGLAMTYGIVRNHGGNVSVRSTPGRGSVFTIYLPLASRGRESAPAADTLCDLAAPENLD